MVEHVIVQWNDNSPYLTHSFLDGTSLNKPILYNTQIFMKFTFKGTIYDHDLM
jgi:hypothetical protein